MKENIFNINEYINKSDFFKSLFNNEKIEIEKIDDGNLNNIFRISSLNHSVVLKQCPEYIYRDNETVALPKDRISFEYFALKEFKKNTPKHIPEVLFFDKENSLVILEYLNEYIPLKYLIINFIPFENIISKLSDTIALNLVYNTVSFTKDKKEFYNKFNNSEIKNYFQDILFSVNPEITDKKEKIKNNLRELEYKFIHENDTLLHGNLKKDSIMIRKSNFYLIDFESSFIGPYGFELSYLLASLIMDYVYCKYLINNQQYSQYLLVTISKILEKFEKSFIKYYNEKSTQKLDINQIINDSFGYTSLQLLSNVTKIRILNKENFANNQEKELLEYTKHLSIISLSILENLKDINKIEDLLIVL